MLFFMNTVIQRSMAKLLIAISLPVKIILIDTTAKNIFVHISLYSGAFISVG